MTPNPNGTGGRYKGPRSPQTRDREHQKKGRLPHGSQFTVQYDAGRERWSGLLTVPAADGSTVRVFRAESSGVFWLLSALDRQYRDAAAADAAKGGVR